MSPMLSDFRMSDNQHFTWSLGSSALLISCVSAPHWSKLQSLTFLRKNPLPIALLRLKPVLTTCQKCRRVAALYLLEFSRRPCRLRATITSSCIALVKQNGTIPYYIFTVTDATAVWMFPWQRATDGSLCSQNAGGTSRPTAKTV